MISTQINTPNQWIQNENSFVSSTNTNSSIIQTLPAPLTAPAGWRSEIIHSNSPLPTDIGTNTYTNNYEEYSTTNTSQIPSSYIRNSNEYLDTSIGGNSAYQHQSLGGHSAYGQQLIGGNSGYQHQSLGGNSGYRQQSVFTEQQQQNIINNVEHQNPPPLIIRKTLPNNLVTYQQNIAVRYLKPPTPPPSGPIIIREVRPPPPPPQSPIQIRQRPQQAPTPPPLVLRERPPPPPPRAPAKIVEKLLPALPQGPRRVVVERFAPCPPKPADVIIERWLPYKQPGQPRVLLERAPEPARTLQEPNLLILHDQPQARIQKQYINQGVVRADPDHYLQRYGGELDTWRSNSRDSYIVDEASRVVPPPLGSTSDRHYHTSYSDEHLRASSPYISSSWDRTRIVSPLPRSSSYHYGYSDYDSPYAYCSDRSRRYDYDSPYAYCSDRSRRYDYDSPYAYCSDRSRRYDYDTYHCYKDSPSYYGSYRTMKDVTPSWNRYCNSSSRYPYSSYYDPCYDYPYSSSYHPERLIRVSSESEFRRVICDLTDGRVPSSLRSY